MEIEKPGLADTVIICCGMTNDIVNPDLQYSSDRSSAGRSEIRRIMGIGRDFGKGPLPSFLTFAMAGKTGGRVGLILVQSVRETVEAGIGERADTNTDDIPPQVDDMLQDALVVKSVSGMIPWDEIGKSVSALTGLSSEPGGLTGGDVRFLIAGFHTEGIPFSIASHLRNACGFRQVAVCSHLIGSASQKAHFAMLRHTYPHHRIQVILDIEEAAAFVGMDSLRSAGFELAPCVIEPEDVQGQLGEGRQRIIELLCMHWTKCNLRPLAGGFSESLLFLADGWKGEARTEPMVLKVDNFSQMAREISGYFEVKDFLGKHIPTFGHPITVGEDTGVGMELATMDGQPETLQDAFEAADVESLFIRFKERFQRSLDIIAQRLYSNTSQSEWVMPYHQLGLNSEHQVRYLKMNGEIINGYLAESGNSLIRIDVENLAVMLKMISANGDGIESETCISHGDLNYQNIICDRSDNVWFIDWTHCGRNPIELDFAKLESDVTFVISKDFGSDDLPNLKKFEEYLLSAKVPADENDLPDGLQFAKWDLRYRKILSAVRTIRQKCFSLKQGDDWLVYRVALLRYALHTLSFDKKRGRGECEVYQLGLALISCQKLMLDLVSDDFHLKIRGERPLSYPRRQRISIDEAPWRFRSPDYSPPYHVDPLVLENDVTIASDGWADPEDITHLKAGFPEEVETDKIGRPLHPRGRTGIAGRGLLGRWGVNPVVNAVILRPGDKPEHMDVLLGSHGEGTFLRLPKGFVPRDHDATDEILTVINREFGWRPGPDDGRVLNQGFSYDSRQTDNAWVEVTSFLFLYSRRNGPTHFKADRVYEEVTWYPFTPDLLKKLNPAQAVFVNHAVEQSGKKTQV